MNTLQAIFDWLLAASLRASVLTLVVLVIQWALQRHLSPRWRYALWLPVLIVLLAPVLPESRWSIESAFQKPQSVEVHSAPVLADTAPVSLRSIAPPAVSRLTPVDWSRIQLVTWALGALLLLMFGGLSFLLTLLRIRRSRQHVSADLLSQLAAISREVGLRHSPQVLMAPAIQSPAVTGLLRPTLLLPACFERDFTVEEARLILQHELTHLKRHDLPLNVVLCVLMALHWFNPLLWLAFLKARADREAACDEQVLANATPQRRSEYGHALLKVEAAFAPLRLSLGFVGMLQRGAALRARIRSIALPSRTRPLTGLLATLCITGMTFLGITRAEKSAAASNDDAMLVAIEVKTVHFRQDTPWDFGGRLKQIDPTDDLKAGGQIEMLDERELRELQAQLRKLAGADIAAWPRVVTQDGKEVVIRSVVNQPVLGGKDTNGRGLITYLPIGFIAKFTPKALQDDKVNVNIDITDSRILATETIHGSQYPVATSRVYRGPVELKSGFTVAQYAWQGYGWKSGKPLSYRPTVTFITTHVIHPIAGGLPADDNAPSASVIENKAQSAILPPSEATKDQGVAKSAEPPASATAAKTAELRRAKPQQYDFAKAKLGDVLRFLATDASLSFIALPEDHPASQKLITFSIKGSPFEVLEILCKANGLVLLLDRDIWYIRPADDEALVGKAYEIPKTAPQTEIILRDIRGILNLPDAKAEPEKQDKPDGPRLTFKKAENSVYAVATRLQHTWIDAYFKGLRRR